MTTAERLEIIEVLREGAELTKWEEGFLDSIVARLSADLPLSEAQEEKLLQIQAKER